MVQLLVCVVETIIEFFGALLTQNSKSVSYKNQNQYSFSLKSETKKPSGAFIISFDEITDQQIDFLKSIGMIQIPKTNKWRQSEAMANTVTVKGANNADFKFKVGVVKQLGYRWNGDDRVWVLGWAVSQKLA
ncbi:hypothetical protein [Thiomicrospira aerophila]|uniref:hypothetical protein n=1 Tax=Thiomicrospira aerophila TaxID=92245 RepID=UPI00138AB549|nr:hypothetical protein [Thiomicrospira aerophila]